MKNLRFLLFLLSFINCCPAEAFEASALLTEAGIEIRPAFIENGKVLIPGKPIASELEVMLVNYNKFGALKKADEPNITPQEPYLDYPHLVYALKEGKFPGEGSFSHLVAIGKGVNKILQWTSKATMTYPYPPGCAFIDKDYMVNKFEAWSPKGSGVTFYTYRLRIHKEVWEKSKSDKGIATEGIATEKYRVGMQTKDAKCFNLGVSTINEYGGLGKGEITVNGEVFGVLEVKGNKSTEKWLVLDSKGYEETGYTFIEIAEDPAKTKPKMYFLHQGGL